MSGRDRFAGRGQTRCLVRGVARDRGEEALDESVASVLGDSDPAVSPDGRSIVFRRNLAFNAGELYTIPLGTGLTAAGDPRRLTGAALDAGHPVWMAGIKDILFSARGSLWKADLPGGGPPARLPFVGEDGWMPAVSRPQPGRPGRLVYVRAFEDSNVWRVETSARGTPSSTPPVIAIASTRRDENLQLSPEGRRAAFVSNRSGEWEIWLADADGSQSEQLSRMSAPLTGTPRWSPDGQRIAFDSNLEGKYEIYVIAVSGGRPVRLTSHPANNHVPSFSAMASGSTSARTGPATIRSGKPRRQAAMPFRSRTTSASWPSSRLTASSCTTRRRRGPRAPCGAFRPQAVSLSICSMASAIGPLRS